MTEAKKILVIDDSEEIRENVSEILDLAGYATRMAEDGKNGLKVATDWLPDLIICDIMMPGIDGYGVLQVLSGNPKTSMIPFVFLSAKAEGMDIRKGMSLGADDYLTKPFEESDLLDVVRTRIRKNEAIRNLNADNESGLESLIQHAKGIEELKHLSESRRKKEFPKKSILYREKDSANFLYFLVSGKVKIYQINRDGKEITTNLIKEGEYFGYESLLKGEEYFESAETLEDSEVIMIPREDFLALMYNNREVSAKFINMLSNNIEEREKQLLDLAYNTVRKRVANALVRLHDKYHEEGKGGAFSMSISREDLASMVGTATESAIRMLSEFKSSGLIEINGSEISVLEVEKLRKAPY